MDKNITVSILGRSYPLKVAADDEAFAREVARFVDGRVKEEASRASGHPPLTHTTFAALRLAEEVLELRRQLGELRAIEEEAAGLAARLEKAIEKRDAGNGSARRAKPGKRKTGGAHPTAPAAVPTTAHGGGDEAGDPPAGAPTEADA